MKSFWSFLLPIKYVQGMNLTLNLNPQLTNEPLENVVALAVPVKFVIMYQSYECHKIRELYYTKRKEIKFYIVYANNNLKQSYFYFIFRFIHSDG